MNLKKGTPAFGLLLGGVLVALGALMMIIGFWKTLLLCVLFALGYFLGTVENKREFMKTTANKLIPDKEVKVIDLKTELKREQAVVAEKDSEAEQAVEEVKPVKKPVRKTEKKSDKE